MLTARTRPSPRKPGGFSLLEVQVAFVLLGVAISGLAPLVVMQVRMTTKLESRFAAGTPVYLVPAPDRWARKLGAPATAATTDPGLAALPPSLPTSYVVAVISLAKSPAGEDVTAHVSATASPKP